jgi:hypothetical protein
MSGELPPVVIPPPANSYRWVVRKLQMTPALGQGLNHSQNNMVHAMDRALAARRRQEWRASQNANRSRPQRLESESRDLHAARRLEKAPCRESLAHS